MHRGRALVAHGELSVRAHRDLGYICSIDAGLRVGPVPNPGTDDQTCGMKSLCRSASTSDYVLVTDRFCDWIASLPNVLARSHSLSDRLTLFDVESAPLKRFMTWLIVGRSTPDGTPTRLTAVLPRPVARAAEEAHVGVSMTHVLTDSVMFRIDPRADQRDVESLILASYGAAMS